MKIYAELIRNYKKYEIKSLYDNKLSAIHELFLQPGEFILGPDFNKPTSKLGIVVDYILSFRKKGNTIIDSIILACKKAHYYENSINDTRIKSIIKSGLYYYINAYKAESNVILLSSKDRATVETCYNNLVGKKQIVNLIAPKDFFGDPIETYNEDAFFINVDATYQDKKCSLKLKMKADNWTIDVDKKILTLNDLKTTGHALNTFMENSFIHYHYSRQFAMYLWMLIQYCIKTYDFNFDEWKVNCNVIVVETIEDKHSCIFPINSKFLYEGKNEFFRLLKMVAYCEMHEYDDNFNFI
ncbi:MAG: hypothetical protein KBT03_10335 [Bacteroidales bacterium]|nr:hypothetical protein [Candidatus Scybalousia scybalohippi]